jgi:kinesin family protein 5
MRAKSIKNKARVNVELSPAELRAMLKKLTAELGMSREYAAMLEEEVKVWRNGGKVDQDKWTPSMVSNSGLSASVRKATSTSPTPTSLSRPDTPTAFGVLDKDEKEEFLRRENELSDQLADRESALAAREKALNELKDEVAFLKEQEVSLMKENKSSTADASELRILNARLETEIKDQTISLDTFKDQVADLKREIDEQKAEIEERKKIQSREKEEEKEKRKQEMLNEMMAKIDMGGVNLDAAGEKLRLHIKKVEESSTGQEQISTELRDLVRNHFAENQQVMRDYQERLRLAQDNAELQSKRKAEVEKLLDQRNREFEDLLARSTESNDPLAVAEVKERLESKWAAQEEMLKGEIKALTEHADKSASEIRRLQSTIETYKLGNEELNRALEAASSGHEDGEKFATAARELERQRKQYDIQYAEFEIVRKSLMKDLQNRCEKVSFDLPLLELTSGRRARDAAGRGARAVQGDRALGQLAQPAEEARVPRAQPRRAQPGAEAACGPEHAAQEGGRCGRAQAHHAQRAHPEPRAAAQRRRRTAGPEEPAVRAADRGLPRPPRRDAGARAGVLQPRAHRQAAARRRRRPGRPIKPLRQPHHTGTARREPRQRKAPVVVLLPLPLIARHTLIDDGT